MALDFLKKMVKGEQDHSKTSKFCRRAPASILSIIGGFAVGFFSVAMIGVGLLSAVTMLAYRWATKTNDWTRNVIRSVCTTVGVVFAAAFFFAGPGVAAFLAAATIVIGGMLLGKIADFGFTKLFRRSISPNKAYGQMLKDVQKGHIQQMPTNLREFTQYYRQALIAKGAKADGAKKAADPEETGELDINNPPGTSQPATTPSHEYAKPFCGPVGGVISERQDGISVRKGGVEDAVAAIMMLHAKGIRHITNLSGSPRMIYAAQMTAERLGMTVAQNQKIDPALEKHGLQTKVRSGMRGKTTIADKVLKQIDAMLPADAEFLDNNVLLKNPTQQPSSMTNANPPNRPHSAPLTRSGANPQSTASTSTPQQPTQASLLTSNVPGSQQPLNPLASAQPRSQRQRSRSLGNQASSSNPVQKPSVTFGQTPPARRQPPRSPTPSPSDDNQGQNSGPPAQNVPGLNQDTGDAGD